jgi:hypothetical protein
LVFNVLVCCELCFMGHGHHIFVNGLLFFDNMEHLAIWSSCHYTISFNNYILICTLSLKRQKCWCNFYGFLDCFLIRNHICKWKIFWGCWHSIYLAILNWFSCARSDRTCHVCR